MLGKSSTETKDINSKTCFETTKDIPGNNQFAEGENLH